MMINIKDSDIEGEYVCDSNKSVERKSKGKQERENLLCSEGYYIMIYFINEYSYELQSCLISFLFFCCSSVVIIV